MRIKGQIWEIDGDRHLVLRLNEPWWSAYMRFNWAEGTEGYSVSYDALQTAIELKKKILVINKYGRYEITTSKAMRYINCKFTARDNTELICLPRFAFKKLLEPIDDSVAIDYSALKNTPLPDNWEETRRKLHE